jgi:hypothetical protein
VSPVPAVRRQAIALFVVLGGLAIIGYPARAVALAGVVVLVAALSGGLYLATVTKPVGRLRVRLDWAMVRWVVFGAGAPAGAGIVCLVYGTPAHETQIAVSVWITTLGIVGTAVYGSSIIDWFGILPRLEGIAGWPRPCTVQLSDDDHNWRFFTQFWHGQRLVTEVLAIGSIAASAIYLAASDTRHLAVWTPIASLCTIVVSVFVINWIQLGWAGVHSRVLLAGSVVTAWRVDWQPQHKALYVVDIDLREAQCMFVDAARRDLDGLEDPAAAFTDRDVRWPLGDRVASGRDLAAPCAHGRCCGVNWYCSNNPRRYRMK